MRPMANAKNAAAVAGLSDDVGRRAMMKAAGLSGGRLLGWGSAALGANDLVQRGGGALGVDDSITKPAGWAAAGGVLGATLGAPLMGVGAIPGAAIGAAGGALLQKIIGGNDGAGSWDISTIDGLTELDAETRAALKAEYNLMLESKVPAAKAAAAIQEKIIPAWQAQQTRRKDMANMLAMQASASSFFQPYIDKSAAIDDQIANTRRAQAEYLPTDMRAAYGADIDASSAMARKVTNAFAQQSNMAPQTYYTNKALAAQDQTAAALTSQAVQQAAAGAVGYTDPALQPSAALQLASTAR